MCRFPTPANGLQPLRTGRVLPASPGFPQTERSATSVDFRILVDLRSFIAPNGDVVRKQTRRGDGQSDSPRLRMPRDWRQGQDFQKSLEKGVKMERGVWDTTTRQRSRGRSLDSSRLTQALPSRIRGLIVSEGPPEEARLSAHFCRRFPEALKLEKQIRNLEARIQEQLQRSQGTECAHKPFGWTTSCF